MFSFVERMKAINFFLNASFANDTSFRKFYSYNNIIIRLLKNSVDLR